jgi:hypothetical protein
LAWVAGVEDSRFPLLYKTEQMAHIQHYNFTYPPHDALG